MPRSIADIRKAAGGLENLTDEDILQATFQKYKAYYPSLDAYAAEVGYGGAGRGLTGSRISAGIDQYQANLLGLGGAVSRAVGAEGLGESFDRRREANEAAAAYAAQRARDLGGVEDWRDVSGVGSALNYAGGLAAQSLPYAGEAVAGALTGGAALAGTAARMGLGAAAARTAGAVAASYPSAVGDILSNQREAGGERLGVAALGGVPYSALNALGLEGQLARGLRPLVQGEGGALRRLAVGVPTSALGEGVSETGQELINQAAGRMAVDPNETLFNPEANKRYIDSFVGGATLGGLVGGLGSLRRPPSTTDETNLLAPEQPAAAEPRQYGLVTQPAPLQQRINEQLGIGLKPVAGKKYASQFEAAFNEPSGQYAQDATTGLERELSMGELLQLGTAPLDLTVDNPAGAAAVNASNAKAERDPRSYELRDKFGVIPTPSSLQLYTDIQASGIPADSDMLTPVWKFASDKPMTPKRLEKAQQLLDAAIIEARKGPTNVSPAPAPLPTAPTGLAAGSPLVQGGMGATGPSNVGNIQPNTSPTITGTPAGQTAPAPAASGQPTTVVKTQRQLPTTRGAAGTTPLVDTSDDALEIARATGNAAEIEAMREDEAGLRADRTSLTDEDTTKIVATRFAKSKNAKRDGEILNAYLTALRTNAGTDKAAIQNAIGDRYGITAVAVRKIGNPSKLVEAGAELGFSAEQVLDLFQVDDNTKAQYTEIGKLEAEIKDLRKAYDKATDADKRAEVADRMAALSERITKIKEKAADERAAAFSAGLQEAGVSAAEGESAGFGFDTEREWSRVEGESKLASQVLELSNQIDSLRESAEQLAAQGQTEAAQAARDAIAARQAKIDAVLAEVQGETKPVSKAAPAVAEARKRWNDAGRDLTKLSVEDLQVLKGYTASIKNKALSDKIAAEISSRGATQEAPNAVQVQSPAGVSVQPKTEAGQGVGQEVRRAEKPASKGEVAILTPQEQYEKVTAGFPVPAWTDLTAAQQGSLTDLARRDQLNLAAVNRFVTADGMKFGETQEVTPKVPYTAKELLADIKAFVRADVPRRKLMVVDSVADLLKSNDRNIRAVGAALQLQGAYGVATDGRAFLVASRINKGEGRATFMHEVGAHLGLENLLPRDVYKKLTDQIEKWVNSDADTDEAILAARAEMRVMSAGTAAEDIAAERLAYFIEEAMLAGIDPTAAGKESAALTSWFRTLWAAFKVAIRKLGLRPDALTAQDVVDMAFGAARLELSGTFHGTAATFRNFSNKFIGTGEGATAYGWGTYLAQSPGIAKGYWKADVRRKTVEAEPTNPAQAVQSFFGFGKLVRPEGSLMRVDTAVSDDQVFDYDSPISKQPKPVRDVMRRLLEPLSDEIVDRTNKDWEDLNGRDLFGTGERDLGLLSNLIMDDVLVDGGAEFDKAVRAGEYHKAASLFLDDNGIQGIKFKDANSRGSNLNTITFDGRSYNKEDLREERRNAFAEKRDADTRKFLLLDSILRFGLTDTQAELEAKIKQRADMFFNTSMESAARFNVKVDEAEERAAANKKANETYEGQQLKWLQDNVSKIDFSQKAPTRNLVVFNDQNIFRVGGQVAADRQRMKFGTPARGGVDRNISKLPKAAQQPVRNMLGAIGDVSGKGLDYLVFTSDLVNRAVAAGIPSAKKFVDLIGKSKAEARENEIAVEKIADMYALVPEKDRGTGENSVNRFLFDSTRESKWGYGQYRDQVMGDRFDALSKESQDFVKAVFEHGSNVLAQKKKVVLDSTNSEYDAMIAVARANGDKAAESKLINEKKATIKRFQTLFKIRDGMPYAPIKRNGSHVVIAKSKEYLDAEAAGDAKKITELESNSDHYHVTFTDGKWEGRTLQQQLVDQGAFADVQLAERDTVVDEMFSGHSALRELTKMRSRVDKQARDGDKSAAKMLSLISQMYLEALAEGSARKSEMRRRGVEGEVDMIRSFAQQGRADANFMASVKYNPQVQDALQEMRTQSKTGDRARKSELFNELAKRYVQSMEYSPRPWLNKLTRMSSIYYLATSPAYYLQNLTQPWMMSVPAMAGQHDYTAASGALFKAYTELGDVMKSAKLLKQQFDFDKVPADVRDAIKELVNRGKIDIGLDTEIGEFKVEGDGYFAGKISAADKALRLAVQKVESINRLSTAMAAYRLELARTNGNTQAATDYADRILTETHGDYTSFNAPRAFNTSVGKVALQFRKFQLIQIAFYAKLIKDALQGNDRKAALKTLAFSLAHTGTLAGLMGMPGYAAISWAIGALLGDDDEPFDVTAEIRKAIGDEAVANLVLKGTPTLLGADISGKVGAGNMLSIMPFSQADLSTTAGRAEALGTLIGGASLGMASRMVDGLGLMLGGDWYRGIEQTMPKGVSDAMKAWRIANEGMTRRNGDIVVPASEISTMEAIMMGLGVTPVQMSTTYERQNVVKELTTNFQERTTAIKNQYTKADRKGDAEAKAEAREAWKKLQDARVRNGLARQPLSNLLKAPAEQRKREKETVGGVQYTKATKKLAQQYAEE